MTPLGMHSHRNSHKVSEGLVALSSSVILAVYAAGYVHTRVPQDDRDLALLTTLATASATVSPAPPVALATQLASPAPTARAAAVPSPYRDGTYAGWGRGRHGSIEVEVVISGGLIVSAEVTLCQTRYPCDVIAALPGEVISLQGLGVTRVSGATESTYAYVRAVNNALEKALL